MMKFIFMLIFMIPLNFKLFWFNQVLYFYLMFMFMILTNWFNFYSMISLFFGVDLMMVMLVLLSIWICSLMIMASLKVSFTSSKGIFLLLINLLLLILILTFSTTNLFMFYLFFEMSLIPTLLLILGWGYQPERIQAGLYLLFYTLLASLPMLLGIFYLYMNYQTLSFFMINMISSNSFYLFISFNIVFLVKFPMYLFHLWLPKAHVEAPISGSMILAGIMLKLGGYGMIRLMIIFQSIINYFNFYFLMISMIGGSLISLICLRQSDMKSLIAYSSVAHMSLIIGSIMTMNYWGLVGGLIMMIAHGLCSSGMFCLANISYERVMSRSLFINKGMINLMPSMSLWWFLLSSSNMAAPPSLNLLSEIILLISLISWSKILMIMLMIMSFFSAAYSLFLYSYSQHGSFYSGLYSFSLGSIREYLLLMLHWLPLNLFILKGDILIL
uniref:NADH dehydrogenase subunit 4 n=1 Tax=Oxytelus varipennis TaxID=1336280 RepID=UPI002A808A59|nr:NADH dehydrogenase subunit 4 [Oxytelus varipennis]WON66038.1 NADH dehydrogenase subunit 4 [Oxytelus varipennis]